MTTPVSLGLSPPAVQRSAPQTAMPLRGAAADPSRMAKAAQDFEAMALGELLQPMFDTVDTAHALFGGGDGEAAWRPLLVQETAKQIAAKGGLGLARPIYAAMLRMQQGKAE